MDWMKNSWGCCAYELVEQLYRGSIMLNQKQVSSNNNNNNYSNDSNSSCSLLSSYTMCQALLEILCLY